MCKMPRGSDRLLTFINNEHMHTLSHTLTHTRKHPLPTFTQAPRLLLPSLRTHTHTYSPRTPPPLPLACSFILRGALVFCMMSSWGASAFGRRLCLSYEMKKKRRGAKKKEKKRKGDGERKEEDGG